MHPIIVLEGPDGAGKTTVAEHLETVHGFRKIHLTYRFKDRMHTYHTAALKLAHHIAMTQPVVIDRWWPSEMTYANAYRGGSAVPLSRRFLHRQGMRHGVFYFWCLPRNRVKYLEHFNELKGQRTEMYDSGMERVYEEYRRLIYDDPAFSLAPKPGHYSDFAGFTVYDWMTWPDRKLWELYIETQVGLATELRRMSELTAPSLRITGNSLFPRLIWVGDRSNSKGREEWPPFSEYGNCSEWLTQQFDLFNAREDGMAIANVHAPDGSVDPDVISWLKRQAAARECMIVAMGAHAGTTLEKHGVVATHRTKHPQWYKRFHHKEGQTKIMNILMEAGLR